MFKKKNLVAWVVLFVTVFVSYHIGFLGGIFKSSSAELRYGEHRLPADVPVNFFYATGPGTHDSDTLFIPVAFSIANTGDKTLKDVKATIRITPASACLPQSFSHFVRAKGGLMKDEVAHDRNTDSQGCSVMYKFSPLSTGQSVSVSDALIMQPDPESKNVLLQVAQRGRVNVTLSYADAPAQTYIFDYTPVSSSSLSSLVQWYKEFYLPGQAIRTRHDATALSYTMKMLSGGKQTAVLAMVPYRTFTHADRIIRMPAEGSTEAVLVESSRYSTSLLFL